ncbi:electron transport complex subunit RsxD [Halieaceae bacterium IMCC14734]|uniref:Ion-translocating oxidoreductase complex subunit D n=1 Tax=Candidatus Litorirhabdus singularis TaxID=2518993 RepID=A0ABT3TMK3_9GAMM|nr:electron transport complex subunit RsxD [Candidatus Litorirhabdus singularis]MCX2982966.1 electron transport complex subunit RsxD [Candidatus Litorirhabdus singularis]
MALMRITSPHAHGPLSTAMVMRTVLLATLPGIVALVHFFGFGVVVNILWACLVAVGCEALVLKLRKRPLGFYLNDASALVTATLLGIALPPYAPWWLIAVGVSFAIIIGKHLYGGMGYNPFNPAMLGYVVLLISFPLEMTTWGAPLGINQVGAPGLLTALQACFMPASVDIATMATPLDLLKQNDSLLIANLWTQQPVFGRWAGLGWEWVNIGFLAGGAWLLYKRIFTWHAPVTMLASLTLLAAIFYDSGSSASGGSPAFHLLSGGTMFAAFFIITDPVSSAVSNRGKLIYGAAIGALIYIIRVWGNYPDAVAFAVLLMNFVAPFIDHYTQPRTYGHSKGGGRSS